MVRRCTAACCQEGVASTLKHDDAVAQILEQLARVVPYDSASVQLLGEGYLEIVGGRGWPDVNAIIGVRFPIPGDNPNSIVITTRQPYMLGEVGAAYANFRQPPHDHIRSWLGVPLIVHNRVLGMLAIDGTQPDYFTADHQRLAVAFANQVAVALENARLFAEVQILAVTDPLTGAYNRRGFFERARQEFSRARRFQRPLSAIMLDLDRFKRVNDRHGHTVGDQVLQTLVQRCRSNIRDIDLLGRYGGEEFVLLLPEIDLAAALQVAERLRVYVTDERFITSAGAVRITISLGRSRDERKRAGS